MGESCGSFCHVRLVSQSAMLWWFIAMIIVFSNTDALIAFSNLTVAATALNRNSKLGYASSCTEPQADMLIWGSGGPHFAALPV